MPAQFHVVVPAQQPLTGPGAPMPDTIPVYGGELGNAALQSIKSVSNIGGIRFGPNLTILSGVVSGDTVEGCAYITDRCTIPGFGRLVLG